MPVREVPKDTEPDQPRAVELPPPTGLGPLEIIPPGFRASMAARGEELSGLERFGSQAFLPTAGTSVGAALGALTGPVAPVAIPVLAGAGGFIGEIISEELGISPENRTAQILSALGPAGGQLLGGATKVGGKIVGGIARNAPPFRSASAITKLSEFTDEAGSLGAKILSKQKGLIARRSGVLFRAARIGKQPLSLNDLQKTRSALNALAKEAEDFRSFPEGRQILRTIRQIQSDLVNPEKGITTETLGRTRQLVGALTDRLENQAGVKLGATKKFFSAMVDDMENIAKRGGPAGRATELRLAGTRRAKLEFAIRDMESVITKAMKPVAGQGDTVVLDGKKLLSSLDDITNPKSANFDKNFASALKEELPEIKKLFQQINEIAPPGSPAGPGSIVYRGLTAGGGSAAGGFIAGPFGATLGAFAGAQLPEMISSLLLTPIGRKAMLRMATLGQAPLNHVQNAVVGQLLSQGLTEREKEQFPPGLVTDTLLRTSFDTPPRTREQIERSLIGLPSE